MKKVFRVIFSAFTLLGFVYVQAPLELFHHHNDKPVCELSTGNHNHKDHAQGETHLHQYESHHCFVCSAQLNKEYNTKGFAFNFSVTELKTIYSEVNSDFVSLQYNFSPSRAPPVLV